jgi:molybdopterin-guanine dinucleotide biosynthesis protein A
VGGASRRFGSPKALALLDGETLATRAWRLLGEACGERLAVGKLADGLELGFPLVDDDSRVRAPLAGMVAGLRAARTELCVIVPVDCPGLTVDAIHRLAGACRDAAVPVSGPLPGVYRRDVLPVLERRLAAGELRLRDAVDELDAMRVPLPRMFLANANTPAELASWAAWTPGSPAPPTTSRARRRSIAPRWS